MEMYRDETMDLPGANVVYIIIFLRVIDPVSPKIQHEYASPGMVASHDVSERPL